MLYQLTPLSPVRTLPEFYVDNAFIPTGEAHLLEVRDAKSYVMVSLQWSYMRLALHKVYQRLFVDECSGSDFIPSSSPGAWLECTTGKGEKLFCDGITTWYKLAFEHMQYKPKKLHDANHHPVINTGNHD
ncbi:MAG: hypothetical protein Q9176_004114 [Flavoplaca citrina]